jgi:hypothetical protein
MFRPTEAPLRGKVPTAESAKPATPVPGIMATREPASAAAEESISCPKSRSNLRKVQSPIIHALTHVLASYTVAHGHWTQECLTLLVKSVTHSQWGLLFLLMCCL